MAYDTPLLDSEAPVTSQPPFSMDDATPLNAIREGAAAEDAETASRYASKPATALGSHQSSNIGVYVRQPANTQRELDVLWSNSRHFHKEDRSPIVFTVAGLLLGVMIASAVFFLLSQKPEIVTSQDASTVTAVQDADLLAEENNLPPEDAPSTVATQTKAMEEESAAGAVQQAQTVEAQNTPVASSRTAAVSDSLASEPARRTRGSVQHRVEPGDTLGGIAYKYYGASTPALVDKIARSNRMTDPNNLTIGQALVIPN
ncbi:MAG: LysM peptidoglycan-binding domain-containing protein [Vampirovibrionales bacterium]|nr:LysM peptidoglycan-binding domain-containing protein [Vampirovibrionales bacterium]